MHGVNTTIGKPIPRPTRVELPTATSINPSTVGWEQLAEATTLLAINGREILTADLAALYTGLSKYSLLELARSQAIPNNKQAKFYYFKKSDLDKWMLGELR